MKFASDSHHGKLIYLNDAMTSERSIFIKIKRLFKFLYSCVAKAAGMFNRTHYFVRIAVTDTHTQILLPLLRMRAES